MEKKAGNRLIREFSITNLALNNRMSVFLILILLTFSGVYSYVNMAKEAFPEVVIPTINVTTPYAGNSPADIENLVTRPLEREINNVSDIEELNSTSQQDLSSIMVEFGQDVDISRKLQDVRDAVDRAKDDLPDDLDNDPTIQEIDFSEMPIMYINVSGDYDIQQLKEYAEDLQEEIEDLREISSADIRGAPEREIAVELDLFKMAGKNVTFRDVDDAISTENVTMSAGDLKLGDHRRGVRIMGEFEEAEEIEHLLVRRDGDETVYLNDVAEVIDGFEEPTSFSRSEGLPVVTLEVVKRSDENLLDASDKINTILDEAKGTYLPADVETSITNDLSRITRNQVSNLENSVISGFILVVLVILFFMGIRNSMFIGLAIPLSMFSAFLLLFAFGVTMNIVVLFALILALGLLVDNGIVVVENIYRLREQGFTPLQAAKEGAGEVAYPIITATATTLSAFIPLVFWEGVTGEFMSYLPITLIIVLLSSLFIALVINPVLTSYWMKVEKPDEKIDRKKPFIYAGIFAFFSVIFFLMGWQFLGGFSLLLGLVRLFGTFVLTPGSHWFLRNLIPRIEKIYDNLLRFCLHGLRPYVVFGISTLLLVAVAGLFIWQTPKVSFFPSADPNYINVYTEFPVGTDIHYTDSVTRELEERVFETVEPYRGITEAVISNVGEGASDPMDNMGGTATPNKSRITVSFYEFKERDGVSTEKILDEVRRDIRDVPGVQITVEQDEMGPPTGRPINLEVSGEDLEELARLSDDIMNTIDNAPISGIEELRRDLETQNPEATVRLDRESARRHGLSTEAVSFELRTALFGLESSQFQEGEEEHPIMVRLKDEHRYNPSMLINQSINVRDGGGVNQVPISTVADIDYTATYGSISRIDMDRVVSIYSNVEVGHNANEIVNEIENHLEDYEMPEGYEIEFTGEQEEQQEAASFLTNALMVSVFLIFLILVSQFNSFIKPFLIIISVIFSTIGVMLGLVIFRMEFILVMTGVGIISLAGVVVNNAIVLVDFIDLQRKRKREQLELNEGDRLPYPYFLEAVVEGGKIRLRPVILTAITTILGLIPLAIGLNLNFETLISRLDPQMYFGGDNAAFWSPMAWTVIFGLIFATFLTLLVLPAMYVIAHRLGHYFSDLLNLKEPEALQPDVSPGEGAEEDK